MNFIKVGVLVGFGMMLTGLAGFAWTSYPSEPPSRNCDMYGHVGVAAYEARLAGHAPRSVVLIATERTVDEAVRIRVINAVQSGYASPSRETAWQRAVEECEG